MYNIVKYQFLNKMEQSWISVTILTGNEPGNPDDLEFIENNWGPLSSVKWKLNPDLANVWLPHVVEVDGDVVD